MKNLKRVLSLALATVMVIGMMVVGANAAFSDQDSIKYDAAVDTLVGLGVIDGMGNNTFAPNGTLTRAQAAKMVAYVKAGANENTISYYEGTTKFTDVKANHKWASGSINYCVANGIIAGMTATTYAPDAQLTGAQLAKMLLVALGYPANSENANQTLVGNNWQLNAIRLATEAGIFKDLDSSFNATRAVTREEACQMIYNSLFLKTWKLDSYSGNTPIYTQTGKTILEGSFNATKTAGVDEYGRPADVYTSSTNADLKVVVAEDPILTYTTGVTGADLKTAVVNAGYKFDETVALAYSRNGGTGSYSAGELSAALANKTTKLGGNGIVLELYADANTKVVDKLVIVVTYAAQATKYTTDNTATTNADERTVTIRHNSKDLVISPKTTDNFDSIYNAIVANQTAGVNTYVSVIPQYDNSATAAALDAALLTPVAGTLNSFNTSAKNFVVGGTTYQYASTSNVGPLASDTTSTIAAAYLGKDVNVYTDAYGYVLGVTPVKEAASTNYALVMDYDAPTMAGQQVKLLGVDGQYVVVNAKMGNATTNKPLGDGTQGTEDVDKGVTLVSYNVVDGVYYLTALQAAASDKVGTLTIDQIKKGNADLTSGGSDVYADSTTVFVAVDSKNVVTTYTGIANVASMTGTMKAIGKGNTASFVFVTGATVTGASAKDLVYIFDTNYTLSGTAEKPLYTYNVLKDGQITTVTFSVDVSDGKVSDTNEIDAAGVYEITSYDSNGNATAVKDATAPNNFDLTGTGTEVTAFANGTLVAGKGYVVDANTLFVKVDATTKAMTIASSADITVKNATAGIDGSKVIVTTTIDSNNQQTGTAAIVFIMG